MGEVARIRLLIVDDHVLVRAGLVGLLTRTRRCEVVAEAATGAQAIARFSSHHPDVTLLDRWLPDMCGEEVVTHLRERDPDACIIMVSIDEGEDDIYRALLAGARGYVSKSIGRNELLAAIEAVSRGETYVSEALRDRLAMRRTRDELSRREMEVLQRLAEGRSNRAIADDLGLSEVTVKVYVGRILQKLEVRDRTHAVATAVARGIVHIA